MRAKRTAIAVAAVAAIALVATACAKSQRDTTAPQKSQKFVFGTAGSPKVLDPALASDGESLRVARQMFETLVQPELGGAKIVPSLATEWKPDSTGLVWTFTLKKGVKFHDG